MDNSDADEDADEDALLRRVGHFTADGPPVANQWFFKQTVPMDGRKFVQCHFERCQLVFETGMFSLEDCKITECIFNFRHPASNVVKIFGFAVLVANLITADEWSHIPPQLRVKLNDDGTLST